MIVLDAFGRIPQAVMQGNTYELGTYDQCVNIFEELGNVTIKGKYCLGGLAIPFKDLEVQFTNLTASHTNCIYF